MENINKPGRKKVFVTVGTTKFPELIDVITTKSVMDKLISLGYNFVQLQIGIKKFDDVKIDPSVVPIPEILIDQEEESTTVTVGDRLTLKYNQYFDEFDKQLESSDLIISHGGAGTCLEVLRMHKPLIVVVNEDLMDNHQVELAEQLQKDGYLYYGTCSTLCEILSKDFSQLKPYPSPENYIFSEYMDRCMGFIL